MIPETCLGGEKKYISQLVKHGGLLSSTGEAEIVQKRGKKKKAVLLDFTTFPSQTWDISIPQILEATEQTIPGERLTTP